MRRASLLDAARGLILDQGTDALTFASVAERAGLARNSVYDYFASRDELVLALCEVELPAWIADVQAGMAGAESPEATVEAYVTTQLRLVADGRHRLATALRGVRYDATGRERLGHLHQQLTGPLADAFSKLGHTQPEVSAALVDGIVNAATTELERGRAAGEVIPSATRIALQGCCCEC